MTHIDPRSTEHEPRSSRRQPRRLAAGVVTIIAGTLAAIAACDAGSSHRTAAERPVGGASIAPIAHRVPHGSARSDDVTRLSGTQRGALEIASAPLPASAGAMRHGMRIQFEYDVSRVPSDGQLDLMLRSWTDGGEGETTLRILNRKSSTEDQLTTYPVGRTPRWKRLENVALPLHITRTRRIELVIEHRATTSFTYSIDVARLETDAELTEPMEAPPVVVKAPPPPPPAPVEVPRPPRTADAKRLLHYQSVGYSHPSLPGKISPRVVTRKLGWRAHIHYSLQPLVDRVGPNAFDWWGHNCGGIWPDTSMKYRKNTDSHMRFNQLELARKRFPQLIDFKTLTEFTDRHGIERYGYVGFPLCDSGHGFIFTQQPSHCDGSQFMRWYGEFVNNDFKGIGHDWSANLPADSPALTVNFRMLRERGIEPFVEAVPLRINDHLLGYSVVANEHRWELSEEKPGRFLTEREILAAGGRTIHLVLKPANERSRAGRQKWRFQTSLRLLREGKTVAVPLDQLLDAGYPVEQLVAAARLPVRTR